MEDRGSPALEKDWRCLCGNPSSLAPSESPAVQTSPQLSKSVSSAHRHLNKRNGLSKLCQSRIALSGDYLLVVMWASRLCSCRDRCRFRCSVHWPTMPHFFPGVSVHEILRKLSFSGSGWNSLHFRIKLKQNIISYLSVGNTVLGWAALQVRHRFASLAQSVPTDCTEGSGSPGPGQSRPGGDSQLHSCGGWGCQSPDTARKKGLLCL